MKKTLAIFLLFAFFFTFCMTGCDKSKKEYKTQTKDISYIYFDTVSIISSYGDTSEEEFAIYAKEADSLLGRYHKLFDIYHEYSGISNIYTINKNAGVSPVEVDDDLIEFLEYCKQLYTTTCGKTNIMLGSVLKIWHDHRELASEDPSSAAVPDHDRLTEAAKHASIDALVIDKDAKTVYITDPEASIDVGAIGKGYATERLYERLRSLGADSIALNIGGNLRTIGVKPSGEKWVSGITNPDRLSTQSFVCRVKIGDTSLVTSGNYERYYTVGGVKYHHIIDPVTLMPAGYFSSVSVFTEDSGLADALSTALFCMSYEDGLALIESLGGVEAIWVDTEYNVTYTSGVEFAE